MPSAVAITRMARELFESGEADAVYVVYSKFISAIRQIPQTVQLLPIEAPQVDGVSAGGEVEFEPSADVGLDTLLPRYFQTLVWQSLLESTAPEFGTRMSAMTATADNAGKMIQTFTLKANRERQAQSPKKSSKSSVEPKPSTENQYCLKKVALYLTSVLNRIMNEK